MLEEPSAMLLKSHSLNEMLDHILTQITQEFKCKVGVVVNYRNGRGKISQSINHGFPARLFAEIEALSMHDIMSFAHDAEKSIFSHRIPRHPVGKIKEFTQYLQRLNLSFGLSFIFKTHKKTWGALHLWHSEPLQLSDAQIYEIEVLNRMISLAFENSWLRKRSSPTSHSPEKELDALNRIISSIDRKTDLNSVLSDALNATLDVLNLKAGIVYLINQQTQFAELVTSTGLPIEYVKQIDNMSIHHPAISSVIQAGQSLVTVELAFENQEMFELQKQFGIKRMVRVPLRTQNHILGFAGLSVAPFRNFNSKEISLLDSISKQLGAAISTKCLGQPLDGYKTVQWPLAPHFVHNYTSL